MRLLLRQRDLQRAVGRGDRRGVVPFHVVRLPVVQVDGFPVRVVARVEGAAVGVEFVGEDEGVFGAAVGEGEAGAGPVGGVVVDETEVADAGDLCDSTKLEMNG